MSVNPDIIKVIKSEIATVLKTYNASLQGDYDGDVNLRVDNEDVGYWQGGTVLEENWSDFTK